MNIYLSDLDATLDLGRLIGKQASNGQVFAVLGDLGAGKTSLAQGVAMGLGVSVDSYVNSPTFTLHQRHEGRLRFHHIDLYRLNSTEELINLGLRELVGVEGVSYIEWPNRAPEFLPHETVWIRLGFYDEGRVVSFGHSNDAARPFIESVCNLARKQFDVIP